MLRRHDTIRPTLTNAAPLLRGPLPPNPGLTVTNNIVINIINRITYDIPIDGRLYDCVRLGPYSHR